MLKTHEHTFSTLQKLFDAIFVTVAWFLAYIIRFDFLSGGQQDLEPLFVKLTPILIILTLYFFNKSGLYKSQRFTSRYKELTTVFTANFKSFFAFVIILYFFAPSRVSRLALTNYFFLSQFLLIGLRFATRNYLRHLRRVGKNLRHVLLVGNGEQLVQYVKTVNAFKDAGIRFLGWYDSNGMASKTNIRDLTKIDLTKIKEVYNPDTLIIGYENRDSHKIDKIIKQNYNDLIPIQVLPNLTYSFIGNTIEDFAGIPILSFNQPKLTTTDLLTKQSFDFILALIGFILISPLLLIIALVIKLTSRGPILYGQKRIGANGKIFTMWKFRSMEVDAEEKSGAVWAVKDDPRRTPLGSFLRSTSLDELPQIWNVLRGDMSLVGPRPERPVFVEKFKSEIPAYMLRHKVKAGITGWAQVNGWRGDTSLEKRIECDIFYIKNWSLIFDVKILFLTFWKGFINKNAY